MLHVLETSIAKCDEQERTIYGRLHTLDLVNSTYHAIKGKAISRTWGATHPFHEGKLTHCSPK